MWGERVKGGCPIGSSSLGHNNPNPVLSELTILPPTGPEVQSESGGKSPGPGQSTIAAQIHSLCQSTIHLAIHLILPKFVRSGRTTPRRSSVYYMPPRVPSLLNSSTPDNRPRRLDTVPN